MVRTFKSNKGFTLVELLVVVAIIGILAAAGIPQYRRMVAKSRQGEAKVALGEVATAQAAFFSEFGAYGNNLRAMGVQSDVSDTAGNVVAAMVGAKTYLYGFITGACAGVPTLAPIGAADPFSIRILATMPAYGTFNGAPDAALAANISSTHFGRMTLAANCSNGTTAVSPVVGNNWGTYTAMASGVIRPGVSLDAPAAGQADVWTVTQARVIANAENGIP